MSGELQIIPVCAPQQMDAEIPAAAQIGGTVCGYQRDLRDVGGQQTSGRLNMQPSGLNIYTSQSCPENARSCRDEISRDLRYG
jgi:hypothetical protein